MAESLQNFLNAATQDTIRATNQFELFVTSGYSDVDAVLKKVTLFGKGLTLPSRTIEYGSVSFKGYEMQNMVPLRVTMEQDHTISIYAETSGETRRAFLQWQHNIMNSAISDGAMFEGDRGVNDKSVIRLHLFDKDNQTVIEVYKFYNVKIAQVGGFELTNEGGEVARFDVTFKSTYWEIERADSGAFGSTR